MASAAYVRTITTPLPPEVRGPLQSALTYILASLKLGRANPGETLQDRGANVQMYALSATTPSTPGEEFSITHGLPSAPYLLVPVLPLDTVGASVVPLTVTRSADDARVYLSSTVADAAVTVLVEG